MAYSDEEKNVFMLRWAAVWGATVRLKYKAKKWELEPFSVSYFVDKMNEELGEPNTFQPNYVTRWNKAASMPKKHHLEALHAVLCKHYWLEGKDDGLKTLLGTMNRTEMPNQDWARLFRDLQPNPVLSDKCEPGTDRPIVRRRIEVEFGGSYGTLPSTIPLDRIGVINVRSRLVYDVVSKVCSSMNEDLKKRDREVLASFFRQCEESSLKRMLDKGGCDSWEAPGVL